MKCAVRGCVRTRRPERGCCTRCERDLLTAAFGPHGEPGTATPHVVPGASASSGLPAGASPGARKG